MGMLARIAVKLPDQSDQYVGRQIRAMVTQLETVFAKALYPTGGAPFTITAAHTVTATDELILADTSGGDITVTLPLISLQLVSGVFRVTVKKVSAANTLTVACTGSDTLDGAATLDITTNNAAATMYATDAGWKII